MKKFLGIFLSIFILVTSIPVSYAANVTVYIVGDSTACEYDDRLAPRTGWGEKIGDYLPKGVYVENKAMSGYSTKLFVDNGRLDEILNKIKEGDILLIQFGHNDQSTDVTKATDTNTTYKEYLKKYIDGAKEKKAVPVLVSSIERRRFNSDGKAVPSLLDRSKAMEELAVQEGIDFIDITSETLRWWNYLGEEGTKEIFLHLDPGESSNYPDGIEDDTHFGEYGADQIAKLIAYEIGKLDLSISEGCASLTSPIPEQAEYITYNDKNDTSEDNEESEEDFSTTDIIGAAGVLRDIGFIKGDENGNLNEDKIVTRAEFLTMLSRIMSDYYAVNEHYFSDVSASHWAADCIAYFTKCKMVDGIGNGLFAPDREVTLSEAVKLILSAMKLADNCVIYPDDYLLTGARYGITVGINIAPDAALTRNEAAGLILNALYIPMKDGTKLISNSQKDIYYVSSKVAESGDGSYENPWKSPLDAMGSVHGNAVVLIGGGEYVLDKPLEFTNGGEEGEPFVIRSDYGEKVIIRFVNPASKGIIVNDGAENIVVSDMNFEMENDGNTSLVDCKADKFSFINNNVKDINIAVELSGADYAKISGNTISGISGVLIHSCNDVLISENTFNNLTGTAVCSDESSANCQIANNIFNVNENAQSASIVLGNTEKSVYNNAVWQNIIYGSGEEINVPGIYCVNTTDCYFYNNIVMGVEGAVLLSEENINPIFRNNIFSECEGQAYLFEGTPQYLNSDYNCFYEAYPRIKENNSKYSNPYFISVGENWNLISFSPCKGSGEAIDPRIKGYGDTLISLLWKDAEDRTRSNFWSMGVCIGDSEVTPDIGEGFVAEENKPFLTLDFSKGIGKFINNGGQWTVEDGIYKQTSPSSASYRTVYTDGFEWENYELSADMKSPSETAGNATGILFRCDEKMQNMYSMRFLANNQVEFVKWENNTFKSIYKWSYEYTPETFYNFRIKADKNKFTFHINGELLGEVEDASLTKGSVGCYSYREENEYDNIKIYTIR